MAVAAGTGAVDGTPGGKSRSLCCVRRPCSIAGKGEIYLAVGMGCGGRSSYRRSTVAAAMADVTAVHSARGLRVGDVISRVYDMPLAILAASSYREAAGTQQGQLDIAQFITKTGGDIAGKVKELLG